MPKSASAYYLYIDGVSSRDLFLAGINMAGEIIISKKIKQGVKTEKLLKALNQFISAQSHKPSGLILSQGGGSFSQTRLICAAANALAYAYGIKVAAVNASVAPAALAQILPKLAWRPLLRPEYRGPAVS